MIAGKEQVHGQAMAWLWFQKDSHVMQYNKAIILAYDIETKAGGGDLDIGVLISLHTIEIS